MVVLWITRTTATQQTAKAAASLSVESAQKARPSEQWRVCKHAPWFAARPPMSPAPPEEAAKLLQRQTIRCGW